MKYFTLAELTASITATKLGIRNNPTATEKACLVRLVDHILDPLRTAYGNPIKVTSGFRCEKLNKAVGGAKSSQHRLGQAADIRSISDTRAENKKIFDLVHSLNLPYDQLINEFDYDWVHVSFSSRNRRQALDAVKNKNGKTIYKIHKFE